MSRLLRMYPGETDFKEVNEKEYNHEFHPHEMERMMRDSYRKELVEYLKVTPKEHIQALIDNNYLTKEEVDGQFDDGFFKQGLVMSLEAELTVYDRPKGKLVESRRWPAKSFVRWWGRIYRMLFSAVNETVTDWNAVLQSLTFVAANGNRGDIGMTGIPGTVERVGATMGIGNGVGANDSGFTNLISPVGFANARKGLTTTQFDTAAIVMVITEGITVANVGGVTVSEIALFGGFNNTADNPFNPSFAGANFPNVMLAYDQVVGVPIAEGGVASPKYTINIAA